MAKVDCEGKVRFDTFQLAKDTAHLSSKRRHTPLAPYRCQECQGYHVGRPFVTKAREKND